VASFANELINGRHDFLRVSGFVLKNSVWDKPARRRGFYNPQSLFSGAAPDKFPVLWLICGIFCAGQPRCGGRDFIQRNQSDKTFLTFSEKKFLNVNSGSLISWKSV
jgi:hypothetical protein